MGLEKPDHIKTILSNPLPILSSSSARIKTLLVVPFGACVLRLDIMIGCARSPLTGRAAISTTSSRRPIALFLYWRALLFALDGATKQKSQIHFLGDVLNYSTFPSHSYPDFYCPQRLSPNSICELILPSVHRQKRPFLPVCKACIASVISIYPCYPYLSAPIHSQLPKISSHFQNYPTSATLAIAYSWMLLWPGFQPHLSGMFELFTKSWFRFPSCTSPSLSMT